MSTTRFLRFVCASAVVALVVFTACSELPQAPKAQPNHTLSAISGLSRSLDASGTLVDGLLWTKPVSQMTATKVIGPAGGTVSIPNGIRVVVPAGAVSSNVTFSVTRIAGSIVAYDFQPHGTTFTVPVQLQQPTLGTNLFKGPVVTSIQGAYYPNQSSLDQADGTATVTEFEPTFLSADNAWVNFSVQHFSGYLVAMGNH